MGELPFRPVFANLQLYMYMYCTCGHPDARLLWRRAVVRMTVESHSHVSTHPANAKGSNSR